MAVGFPDRVVDIDEGELVGAVQDRRQPGQLDQQPGGDRSQLPDVAEPVAAQVGAQGGRRTEPVEHPSRPMPP